MAKIWNFIRKNSYVRTLLLAAVLLTALILIVLAWLDIYTQHGKAVEVPDVKGLQVEDAAPFFENKSLHYVVVDSTYFKNVAPGSIVEVIPQPGTKVKLGRTIFLTINSFSSQMYIVPEVQDLSQRQALAMLQAIGFESVQIRSVPGAYRDLVVGLEYKGRNINPGERIPANSRLTLLVSSGHEEIIFSNDSIIANDNTEESWF